jgi:hypothetical protein
MFYDVCSKTNQQSRLPAVLAGFCLSRHLVRHNSLVTAEAYRAKADGQKVFFCAKQTQSKTAAKAH